jgi:hypothetical protein
MSKKSKKGQNSSLPVVNPTIPSDLVGIPKSPKKRQFGLPKRPSKRELQFAELYMQSGNLAESAKQAGYQAMTRAEYALIGGQLRTKLGITSEMVMELHGLTEQTLFMKINEGLNANIVKPISFQGKLCAEPSYPDYSTRAKYAELLKELRFAKKQVTDLGTAIDGITYQIVNYGKIAVGRGKIKEDCHVPVTVEG